MLRVGSRSIGVGGLGYSSVLAWSFRVRSRFRVGLWFRDWVCVRVSVHE